jgi:hypothetical protein
MIYNGIARKEKGKMKKKSWVYKKMKRLKDRWAFLLFKLFLFVDE